MKNKNEKNFIKGFVICECIIMTMILMVMFVSIILIYMNSSLSEKVSATESTLLATGLAVIGIAISVWAGLNIIQVLEKDKLRELGEEVTAYKQERYTLNRKSFLENVLLEKNELNQYIYERLISLKDEKQEFAADVYFELNIIEKMFQKVYNEQFLETPMLSYEYYEEAIERCKLLLHSISDKYNNTDVFVEYLKIRINEFSFFKGYTKKAKATGQSYGCFQNVIDGFTALFIGLDEPKQMIAEKRYIDDNITLTAYMLNTVGESYSKILDMYGINEEVTEVMHYQANKAEEYYEALNGLLKSELALSLPSDKRKSIIREVYYRNYGVVLERICTKVRKNKEQVFTYDSKIRELYHQAVNVTLCNNEMKNRYKPFYAYLSFYIKVMKNYNLKKILRCFNGCSNGCCDNINKELIKYTKEALCIVEVAEKKYPLMLYFVKCRTYLERDLAIWAILENNDVLACKHYENMKNLVNYLNQLEEGKLLLKESYPDEMLKELRDDLNALEKKIV